MFNSIYSRLKMYIKGNKLLSLGLYAEFISVSISSEKTTAGMHKYCFSKVRQHATQEFCGKHQVSTNKVMKTTTDF